MDEKYLQDLYEWIKKNDSSYEGRYDYNQFKQKMQDESYASKMHEWIGGIDNTFLERRPLNNFLQLVKGQQQQQVVQQEPAKKKELSASLLEGGFSDFLKSEQPQQEYKPTTPIPGTDYNAPQNTPIVFTGQQEEDPYGIKRMEQQMFGEGGTAMPKSDYFAQVGAKEKKEAKIGLEYAIAKEETKKLQQKEQTDLDKKLAENLAIKQSPEFASSLNKIDQSIYTQDDYINNLNREYQQYGVTVTKGGWWGEKLIARTDDGKKMIEINTLIEDPNERLKDLNSLKKFISENAKISKEEDFLSQALRAKNMRSTARINDDGTQSTVKFISFDNKVIPTLFPKTDKWYESYSSDKKDWIELPFDEALKEATKRGEVFTFKTNEEAEAFAKGAWKDISKLDVEGDKFYRSKGRDYITEKKRWERYDEIDDIINFYEGDQKDMAEFKKQNPTLFVNGMFRTDIDQYIGDLKKERESLRPLVKDMTFFSQEGTSEKSRMDFDFHLAEMQKKASSDAAAMVREAKAKVAQSNQESMEIFGVPIDKLTEDKEAMRKNPQAYVKAVSDYTNALMLGQTATIKYTEAQTYFDAKINKDINNRFTEDGEAVYNSIVDGYNNGLIGDQLLALTIPGYSATSGFSSKEDAARYMAEKLAGMSQGQSRVMTRLESAKTARDWWDVMMDDPFEGMALAVAGSISQMLPYGTKITVATTAAGAGTGALFGLAGGPFAPVTVTGGAISGGLYGLRTGQALTGAATEYTTAFMDAVRNQDYNPLDPKSLEAALNDQDVWDEAARVGAARGIPIAVVDYLTAGLAGNILKPSKLASRGTKITRGIAENVVLDPLMESGGELAAQTSEMALGTGRKELSWSEIALEGIGSMGTNTPNFLVNTYKNAKENTDIDLAYSLTNAKNVAKEKVSDERISNWANNMFKLGKIDESVNQRIQENVGLRRSAKEVLSVGEQKGKASPEVTARTMELLSAKEQLSATKNRQEVYGQEIRAINEELAAIGKSKQIPAKEQQVNLEGLVELVPESERGAVGEYMIDGKRYTKQQFLDRLNSIKPERLSRVKIAIKGDPEVSQTFKEKIDAIQKQTTGEVSVQPEAGAGQEMEVGGPEAKPQITPEESKRKEDLVAALEATDKDVIAIGDELLDRKEAQAELEAITQKEQAPVTEQGGMEQAEGLGTQLETVAKEEEVTPAEVTPAEVVEKTPEQEADLLEELLTGKKKEPVSVEPMAIEPVVEEEAKVEIPKAEEVAETDIEIKDTQTTPEEVQQQIETFDEEALPEEEKPKPGTVAELSIEDINADPERFQYKEVTDKEAGVTEQFKGKMPFRKELAGVISVWVDPADGKTYVINGHHRLEFARRSGEKTMNVIYIDAKNASEARLKGAMQNIAEGMGTDMDAAKVFRETGMTVEQVQQSGINVKGAKAMNGLSLASLSDNLFNLVTQGKLSQTVGIIIGSTIKSKDVQEQFYNVIKGKNLNNATIKVMAEDIQAAPTENVEQMDLFGVTATEQASYQQRASFIAGIRAIVSKAKNILGKAAKSKEFLEEYGNEIDVATTETGSRESAMALAVFDRLRNTSPEIRALIDKGVERIKNGENKNKVLNETAKQIIEATPRILEGVTGQPVAGRGEVKESSTKGKQGAKGKKLADAVRKNLKIKGPDGLQSNILGILPAIWNAGVETMAKAIEAGVAINEAVQKAIEYIRENHGKKFNEAAAEKKLLIGHYKGAIEVAREAKVTDEGLKAYFKRQGLTDAQIEALLTFKEKAEKKPISKEKKTLDEAKLPGYNEMMDKVDAMIARQVKRGTPVDKIAKNLDNLLRKFDAYINATDAQKKALEQEARNRIGAEQRIAPSFGRILGAFKDITALTTKEKSKIVNNIMQLAKDAASDLAKEIRSMKVNGKITTSQLTAIQNRLSKVNFANETSVKSFVDYMANVFSDVEYANKIQEVRKLQDKVKKVNHVSMKQTVKEFASINPERIPANKLLEYIQALDDMSTRTPFYQKMNDMFDEVMSYKSESKEFDEIKTLQALNDKLESIEINKVKSVEDYVALIRDINSFKKKAYQLLQEGVITKEEYDEVIDNVGKDQAAVEKKYEKELAALKEKLIQEINGLKPKVHPDFTPEEAALINKYLELSDADLASLSPEDLYILNDLLSNIKEDLQLDYFRLSEIVSKAYTNSGGQKLATQINASKFNKSSEQGRKLLAEYEASFWEGLLGLGRATSGALQKFVVAPFNRAIASYENYLKESYSDFLKLKKKYNMKDYNMHRLGILTTYLQEYMAQFDSKNENVKDIGSRDWFGEIISNPEMRDGYQSAKASALRLIGMGSTELKIIEKIYKSLPKEANGKVDPKAVYDSFMANDGKYLSKEEKAFFDDVMAWKQKNLTSKQKAANEMNGSPFKEIPFHMMRVRLDRGAKQISPTAEGGSGTVRIEAGTGKERSSQRVGPIMTNFEQIFTENLEQTGRNYYLQEAINDINNTLAVAKKDLKGEKVGLINTISGTISDALNFEFDKTDAQVLFKGLLAARAAETLFNPIRTAVELTSAIISYPFRAKTPEGYRALFGKQGQMKKLLEFTDSPIRLRDNINKAIDISDGKIKPKNKFEKAVNYLSGLPERTMLITSWMPTFNNEFKEITGEKFDINKFNSNEKYRQKYGKAIKEAAAVADAQTEKIIGSTTKAGGRRDIRIAPKILANVFGLEGKVKKNTNAGQILGFFSNYPFREITEFFNGFREAAEVYRQGDKLKAISQLQKPLGVVLNVAAYGYLSAIVYATKLMLLGDEEDEKKGEAMLKELLTFGGFMDEFQGNAISLAASKYAAGGRALLQIGATIAYESTSDEAQKAKIKKILKNSVFLDTLPVEKAQGYGGQKEILSAVASYVPQFVLGAKRWEETLESIGEIKNIYKKFEEGGLDALSEDDGSKILGIGILIKSVQLGLNIGMGVSLPMYNDIKMYMRGVKKDAGVGDIKIATEEEGKISKEAAYKNYKTLEEFQLADPEGYDEYSKEGGLLDQYRKQEKEKREKSKDKRESELDVKYGRLPFKENSMREDALQGYPTIEKLKEANPELHDRLSEEGGALYKLRQHNKRMEELREKALGGYTSEADFKALNPTKYEKYISEGGLLYKYNKIKEVFKSDDRSEKMSEAEYKRRFPKEYRENYGPGSNYQLESYDRKAKKRAEEREKMREARSYGY